MTNESTVEDATEDDAQGVLELLKICHAEDGDYPLDEARVRRAIAKGIYRRMALIGVIRGSKVRVEASIGLFLETPWNSADRRLTSRWEYVHPGCRRSSHAKNLLIYAKGVATTCKATLVVSLPPDNGKTARKGEMMARQLGQGGRLFVFSGADCAPRRAEVS